MDVRELKSAWSFLKEVFQSWSNSKTPRLGAALAYYTVFAVAPLFIIAIAVAGFWFGEETARKQLFDQVNALVGKEGGQAIQSLVVAANKPKTGTWATVGAAFTLLAAATAVFVELQDALNTIWGVQRKEGGGIKLFIKDRILSFAMILGVGFLLLVSLILNAVLSAFDSFASGSATGSHIFWSIVNFATSLGVVTLLFAMIFKILPDVKITWRNVWMGALVTALLFNLGKFLIGVYLGRSSMVSVYGAAGSLIVILLWVYYSAQILFFGAEFTRIYAEKHGSVEAREAPQRRQRQAFSASPAH